MMHVMRLNNSELKTDKDHNILFVTGHSGSGKTLYTNRLYNIMGPNRINVIHLDAYFDPVHSSDCSDMDFNEYLKEIHGSYCNIMTYIDFAERQYEKGKVVVVEGFQILDWDPSEWEFGVCKNSSLMLITDNAFESFFRSYKKNKDVMKFSEMGTYISWYWSMSRKIKAMKKMIERVEKEHDNK